MPSLGSLCGENNNSRTLGSFPSKAERVARGRAAGKNATEMPKSGINVWTELGLPERTGSEQKLTGGHAVSKHRLWASKCPRGQVLTIMIIIANFDRGTVILLL